MNDTPHHPDHHLFNPILSLIDLPEDIKEQLVLIVNQHTGNPRDAVKPAAALLENYRWTWPDHEEWFQQFRKPEKKKAEFLCSRLLREFRWHRRLAQMLNTSKYRPFWLFMTVTDSRTPISCKNLHHRVERYDNKFWLCKPVFCHHPECRCYIRTLNKRQLEREFPT